MSLWGYAVVKLVSNSSSLIPLSVGIRNSEWPNWRFVTLSSGRAGHISDQADPPLGWVKWKRCWKTTDTASGSAAVESAWFGSTQELRFCINMQLVLVVIIAVKNCACHPDMTFAVDSWQGVKIQLSIYLSTPVQYSLWGGDGEGVGMKHWAVG